jgi:hypothetical protein
MDLFAVRRQRRAAFSSPFDLNSIDQSHATRAVPHIGTLSIPICDFIRRFFAEMRTNPMDDVFLNFMQLVDDGDLSCSPRIREMAIADLELLLLKTAS